MEKVGFIGLGRMGRPMASNLCRKGFRLTVNDVNPEAVAELELLQASAAATVAGKKVPLKFALAQDRITLTFDADLKLTAGQALQVEIA